MQGPRKTFSWHCPPKYKKKVFFVKRKDLQYVSCPKDFESGEYLFFFFWAQKKKIVFFASWTKRGSKDIWGFNQKKNKTETTKHAKKKRDVFFAVAVSLPPSKKKLWERARHEAFFFILTNNKLIKFENKKMKTKASVKLLNKFTKYYIFMLKYVNLNKHSKWLFELCSFEVTHVNKNEISFCKNLPNKKQKKTFFFR